MDGKYSLGWGGGRIGREESALMRMAGWELTVTEVLVSAPFRLFFLPGAAGIHSYAY